MKWLVVALLVAAASAELPNHLQDNKVPIGKVPDYTTTCDECKSLAKRFVDAVHDPTKLAELKIILSALCDETSYVDECKVIVANLDKIVKKMEPFFADAEKVCKLFHLCSNSNLDKFHRVALVFVKRYLNKAEGKNDLACDECKFAAEELKAAIESAETQKKVKAFFSDQICAHLGKYRGSCDLLVEEFLPELFQELDKALQNPEQACGDIGFCSRENGIYKKKAYRPARPLKRLLRKVQEARTSEPHKLAMSCIECKIIIDGVLIELHTNSSMYGLAADITNMACPALPEAWNAGCLDFLGLYGETVVSMTLDQFDSEGVCETMKCCNKTSYAEAKAAHSAVTAQQIAGVTCESCKGLSTIVRTEISQPDFAPALESAFDHYLCKQYVPKALRAICENFTASYTPKLVKRLSTFLDSEQLCHNKLHVC